MLTDKKGLSLLSIATLVVAIAVSLTGCGSGNTGPGGLVSSFLMSIDNLDTNKFLNCFYSDVHKEIENEYDEGQLKDTLKKIDETLTDKYGNNWSYKVAIGSAKHVETKSNGIPYYVVPITVGDQNIDITLIKRSKTYYIDQSAMSNFMGGGF